MKKLKLFGLIAMMLVVATVLCSCGNLANFNKVFNKAYDMETKLFKEATEIADLKDFTLSNSNQNFAVFAKDKDQKVYNFNTNEVVATYTNNETTTYAIELLAGVPAYCVTKTADKTTSKAYYDLSGANFANVDDVKKEIGSLKIVGENLVIINAVAYVADLAEGKFAEQGAVPAYVSYAGFTAFNGEFFYAVNGGAVVIYDLDFAPVAVWNAPSYAVDVKTFVLNNGAVLAQYKAVLDEDEKKFDFFENGNKYDLVSVVINTKGKVKDVNLDYVVKALNPNSAYYDAAKTKEENVYTNKFENIAVIAKIENQMIDNNEINYDLVLMNNSGKAQKSLKVVDGQKVYDGSNILLPYKLTADLFAVGTVYGAAIVNNKGKVQFAATEANINFCGGYFYVADRAIYDADFNVVYDLIENEATIVGTVADTIFVEVVTEKKDDAAVKKETLAFIGGAAEGVVVNTWDKEAKDNKTFAINNALLGYTITDAEGNVTYYAADMTEIFSVKKGVAFAAVTTGLYGDVAIYSVTEDGATKYYAFTK